MICKYFGRLTIRKMGRFISFQSLLICSSGFLLFLLFPTFSYFSYFFVLILLFPTFSSNPPTIPSFLCRLRSIAAHRDHFVRRLSVCACVCLSGSHTFLIVTLVNTIETKPLHISLSNLQDMLTVMRGCTLLILEVRGQRSRSHWTSMEISL